MDDDDGRRRVAGLAGGIGRRERGGDYEKAGLRCSLSRTLFEAKRTHSRQRGAGEDDPSLPFIRRRLLGSVWFRARRASKPEGLADC